MGLDMVQNGPDYKRPGCSGLDTSSNYVSTNPSKVHMPFPIKHLFYVIIISLTHFSKSSSGRRSMNSKFRFFDP